MNLILFGAPGAGKGSQSALLVARMGYVQVSTGDLFRAAIKGQTELGKKAQSYMDRGDLVPDEIVIGMVEEALKKLQGKAFIMDGFPRTVAQAEAFDVMLKRNGVAVGKVISLEVPTDVLLARLAGRRVCKDCGAVYHVTSKPPMPGDRCAVCQGSVVQRNDDREDVVANRLATYSKSTEPLKDYYRGQGKFLEVNGNGELERVYTDLVKAIG